MWVFFEDLIIVLAILLVIRWPLVIALARFAFFHIMFSPFNPTIKSIIDPTVCEYHLLQNGATQMVPNNTKNCESVMLPSLSSSDLQWCMRDHIYYLE